MCGHHVVVISPLTPLYLQNQPTTRPRKPPTPKWKNLEKKPRKRKTQEEEEDDKKG
jgi:hypothetical protein